MYVKFPFEEQKKWVALPVFGKVFLRSREAPAVRLLLCTSRPSLWSWFAKAGTRCEVENRDWQLLPYPDISWSSHIFTTWDCRTSGCFRFLSIDLKPCLGIMVSSLAKSCARAVSQPQLGHTKKLTANYWLFLNRATSKIQWWWWSSSSSSSSFFIIRNHHHVSIWSLIPWNCWRDTLKIPETSKNK